MTKGLSSAPSPTDDPDWSFQGLTRQQLETARQNCAGMAAKDSLQQIRAVVAIQAYARGWLIRRRVGRGSADAVAGVEQHAGQDSPSSRGQEAANVEVLSPALRTSPGTRKTIDLDPPEPEDDDAQLVGQQM